MHEKTKKRQHYGPRWVSFGKFGLRLLGWRWIGERPPVQKCIITAAPHTSNWDLLYTLLASMALGIPAVWMMKDSWFFWPLGPVFRWLGGIPVNRSKRSSVVDQMVKAFAENDWLYVIITPEGTRKKVRHWRTGFYWMALGAEVPILLGIINYRDKTVGVGPHFKPSGDLEKDFAFIRDFYHHEAGLNPEYRKETESGPVSGG
jgi:1-acyl-sn-glycerol-3-phosphate acyltransferase